MRLVQLWIDYHRFIFLIRRPQFMHHIYKKCSRFTTYATQQTYELEQEIELNIRNNQIEM